MLYILFMYVYIYIHIYIHTYIHTDIYIYSAQNSFIQKFKLDFCDNISRTHTVWARSKT